MLKERIQGTNSQLKEKIRDVRSEYTRRKKEREREKERDKRQKGLYRFGQVKLKHSTMGVRSCEYAAGSIVLLLLCILISYLCNGKAGGFIGGIGIIVFVLAVCGIRFSLKGRKERNKNYVTCKIGLICNGILVLGIGIIFVGGFF